MKGTIVYIGSDIPDKAPAGVRVFANALALKIYGYEMKIISVDKQVETYHSIYDGIETWHLSRPRSTKDWVNNLLKIERYTSIIDKIEDVKLIIAYEFPAIAFSRLMSYCKRRGIKLISECAEWQKWENLGHLRPIARMVRVLDVSSSMHIAYKKSDGLIVTSHYFDDFFKGCSPTLVLPTLQCRKIQLSDEIQKNKTRKFIYAGQLGYRKDMLTDIIAAFAKLNQYDFEFNILGLSREEYIERFPEEEIILSTVNHKIIFWGKVSHSEVLKEVSKSDFSLIIRESIRRNNVGFPTKFGESITCGTPVIVSDFSDVVRYTKEYGVGIVTDINHIQDGVERALLLDDEELLRMHKNCRSCNAFYYEGNVDVIGKFIDRIIQN